MALAIATNNAALRAAASASSVNRDMETSMARLSSGKRINSASDDAAGVAISSRLTSNIRGTDQAIRNALDGQALIDTAEGAHKEIENILQRMREIAVQAANDTNNQQDRDNLQAEIEALTSEVDRIAKSTSWAGKDMLDGTFEDKVLQVGANTSSADQVKISIKATGKDELFPPTTTSVRTEATVVTATADSPEFTTTVTQKRVTTGFFSESGEVATSTHPGENNSADIVLRYNHPNYASSPNSISFLTDTTDGADSIIEIQGFEYTVTAGTAAEKTANLVEQLQADNVSITTTADPNDATLTLIGVSADVLSDYAEAFGTDSFEVFANPLSADGEGTDGINLTATTEAPSLIDDYVKPPSGTAITTTVTTTEETGPKLGTPTPVGPEFKVSGETTQAQLMPTVTKLNDGGFLVTWLSGSRDVFGQRYDSEGATVGTEFQINSQPASDKPFQAVTTLANGDIVVAWESSGEQAIIGQRFDSTGATVGAEFQVNTENEYRQSLPTITGLIDGGFIIAWQSQNGDGNGDGILGQRYDSSGKPVNQIGSKVYPGQENTDDVSISMDESTGTLKLQFLSDTTGGADSKVELGGVLYTVPAGSVIDKAASLVSQLSSASVSSFNYANFLATPVKLGGEIGAGNGYKNYDPEVVILDDNSFILVWESRNNGEDNYEVFGQIYDTSGGAVNSEFQINSTTSDYQLDPSISKLNDGGFVVTWSSRGQDGAGSGIYGQRYDSTGAVSGPEFQINTFINGDQVTPSVVNLNDGGFVVTWSSGDQDGGGYGIYGQRYDSTGAVSGPEFQINTASNENQFEPAIVSLDDGGFLVAWTSGQSNQTNINAQRFDTSGNAVGAEFQINSIWRSWTRDPSIAPLVGGGFVVTWNSQDAIYGQKLDSLGNLDGEDFQVSAGSQAQNPSIVSLSDGGFIVTWKMAADTGWGGYGKRYDALGNSTQDFSIGSGSKYYRTGAFSDNSIIVAWDGVSLQRFEVPSAEPDGTVGVQIESLFTYRDYYLNSSDETFSLFGDPLDPTDSNNPDTINSEVINLSNFSSGLRTAFQINTATAGHQTLPQITELSGGGFVVTWTSPDENSVGVSGQGYDSLGEKVGTEFEINSYTTSLQGYPSIASLNNGGFLVTWISDGQDGDRGGIFGQRFDENSAFAGTEFQVNTTTEDIQSMPSTSNLNDGGFLITWSSNQQDGSSYGVYGQRYDSDGDAVGSEFLVNTTTQGAQYSRAVTTLENGDSAVVWSTADEAFFQLLEFPTDLTGGGESTTSITNTSDVVFMDVSSRNNALIAIGKTDTSLARVSTERSKLGAVSNRLSHTVNNLTNISSNLSAARGGIEDADFALETTQLAKLQILNQASTAMLAQANASKQNILSLLQ